jgi:CheY-like chemotaxis protein
MRAGSGTGSIALSTSRRRAEPQGRQECDRSPAFSAGLGRAKRRWLPGRLPAERSYEVAEATTVDETFALVASFKPGLVICDVRMPDGGVHRRVREAQPEIMPGFIFITGDLTAVCSRWRSSRGVAILAKPFTASDLDALLVQIAPVGAR